MEKQVSVARLLLSNGADIEALDAHGATALH
jgi:ankyrin repeat protein